MLEGNPISEDTINKILASRAEKKELKAVAEEEEQDYMAAINRLFSSPDGKYFLNKLKRFCAINSFDNELNPAKLIEDNGKRKVFLTLIRPYLDVTLLSELEQ